MQEFKSSIFIILKDTVCYIFAILVTILIVYNMLMLAGIYLSYSALGVLCAIGISVVLLIIWFNWIRIVVQDGEISIYRGKKLKKRLIISDCRIDSRITTRGFHSDCQLTIEYDGGIEWLDCSMLGKRRYKKLLEAIGLDKPIKVDINNL